METPGPGLSLLLPAHPFTVLQLELSVRNLLQPFKGCSHCTQIKSHLHNATSKACMIWLLSIFSNHIWCIFIHYPLTTKTIFHFLKLSSGFITLDTPYMLFSPWIYSLHYSDYFMSSLGWRGHPIHLFKVRFASLCFQTTFWNVWHHKVLHKYLFK